MSAPPQPNPLAKAAIDRFLAFHADLMEAKRTAGTLVSPRQPGEEGNRGDAALREAVTDIYLRLRAAICPTGAPPPSLDGRPDIGYVMASLADEAMLHQVEWPGRAQWMGTLLEQSLYGSRVAGEEIFDLGQAIADGAIVGRADLAAAILLALSLGFRGRWRDLDDDGAIDRLRRQLYEAVHNQPPPSGLVWQWVMPSALEPVLADGRLRRLPRTMPWLVAIVVVLVVAHVVAGLVWRHATADVMAVAAQIRALGATAILPSDGQAP